MKLCIVDSYEKCFALISVMACSLGMLVGVDHRTGWCIDATAKNKIENTLNDDILGAFITCHGGFLDYILQVEYQLINITIYELARVGIY